MLTARTDILVSSDDNYLQAKGGVAKAILDKAGSVVEAELARRRRHPLRQGDIAVTGGGLTGARAILHPAIIDLDQSRYPNQSLIRKVVRRSLSCAVALGAGSIAFPVLGGGTASKYLEPWESIQAIVGETLDHVRGSDTRTMGGLIYIALYVYDPKDIKGDINALIEGALSGGTD
jgi:O-acetyl-ADP-ribose deacetylase (regulator of RNase III)